MLLDIASRGGMRPPVRVERWLTIARITLADAGGDLDSALRTLPLAKARTLLKTFPAIGDPGADKILLFSGVAPLPEPRAPTASGPWRGWVSLPSSGPTARPIAPRSACWRTRV